MNTLAWLLKREMWEHRGGMLTAQWVTGCVLLGFLLMGLIWTLVVSGRLEAEFQIGVDLGQLITSLEAADPRLIGSALDGMLFGHASLHYVVLYFVVFFYCLGALYDDRRDRSMLFWKSLPLSDTQTVVSKLLIAAVVAPLIAWAVIVLVNLSTMVLLSLFVLVQGGNPIKLIWMTASPIRIWFNLLLSIPVMALWSLPAFAWLLLASSWARSKPFLWAVVPPVVLGILNGWFQLLQAFQLPSAAYWEHVVLRLLAWPVSAAVQHGEMVAFEQGQAPDINLLTSDALLGMLADPSMWIGVAISAVMIAGAIALRRYRDES